VGEETFRKSGDGWDIPSEKLQPLGKDMQLHGIHREKRRRGGPKITWQRSVKSELREMSLS
jgi:hypothetical protein